MIKTIIKLVFSQINHLPQLLFSANNRSAHHIEITIFLLKLINYINKYVHKFCKFLHRKC